jgi:hypothetical protein
MTTNRAGDFKGTEIVFARRRRHLRLPFIPKLNQLSIS